MGLHAGLYTQRLSNRAGSLVHEEDASRGEVVSLFTQDFLKNVSNQVTCPQCHQKFMPDGSLSEWLGEREEGP